MAKPAKKSQPAAKPAAKETAIVPFGKKNYLWFVIGLAAIITGFIFLALGDTVIAPILLVAGYCVFIPVAILIGGDKEGGPEQI